MMDKKSIETEYKFFIADKKEVIGKLNAIKKADYMHLFQKTSMYDNKERLMQKTDGRIRVRVLKIGKEIKKSLSYKKPLSSKNGAKREIEYEIFFSDNDQNIEKIINKMGFNLASSYERYQSLWVFNDSKITLDEYPFANVLEIEGDYNKIIKIVNRLELNIEKSLTDPIDTLFNKWRKKQGLPFTKFMHFKDFNK